MKKKLLWQKFLLKADENCLIAIAEVLDEDDRNIYVLTRNLEEKLKALKRQDCSEWIKIIEEENEILKNNKIYENKN